MIDFKCSLGDFVKTEDFDAKVAEAQKFVAKAQQDDFGGWVDLPVRYDKEEFARIKQAAARN